MEDNPELYNPLLRTIAVALDVPVEAFLSDPLRDNGEDVIALLRAWSAIKDTQGQRRILRAAQYEADRSADGAGLPIGDVIRLASDPD